MRLGDINAGAVNMWKNQQVVVDTGFVMLLAHLIRWFLTGFIFFHNPKACLNRSRLLLDWRSCTSTVLDKSWQVKIALTAVWLRVYIAVQSLPRYNTKRTWARLQWRSEGLLDSCKQHVSRVSRELVLISYLNFLCFHKLFLIGESTSTEWP
jgi:hypothetical protein